MSIASAQAPHCTIVSIIDRAESFLSNDPPPPDIYTLSLHDALPISYLLWKSDGNAIGQPTSLWSRRLSPNGLGWQPSSSPVRLLSEHPGTWQAPAIEGPAMVRSGTAYYLFYGAGRWNPRSSGVGYAVCDSR